MSLPDVSSTSARFASPLYLKSTEPGQVPISLVHFPVLSARNVPVAKTFGETSIVLVKTNAGNVVSVTPTHPSGVVGLAAQRRRTNGENQ